MSKLTPAQVETLDRVWLETTNASEAARQAGCSERSARRYILRRGLPKSAELYAQALATAEADHLALVNRGRRRLAAVLAAADDDAVPEIVRAANDSLRAVSQTRSAHLKVSGLAAADRHEHTVDVKKLSDADLDAEIARLTALASGAGAPGDAAAREDAPDDGAGDDAGETA